MSPRVRGQLLLALAGAAVSCGPRPLHETTVCEAGDVRPECTGSPDDPIGGIVVSPGAERRDVVEGGCVPAVVCYRAMAQRRRGAESDVTKLASWSVYPAEGARVGSGACIGQSTP